MDRAEPPEPPGSESPSPTEPPATPPEPPEPPAAAAPKPRTPATVLIAIALLWLLATLTAWVATVSAVATSFEVSVRYAGAWSPLEFIEPALIAAVAVLFGLLAIKVRSGRGWARHIVLITTAIALAAALLTGVGLNPGTGTAGTLLFALLLVLLLLRPARDWCDCDAPRHSPKIGTAAQPPHQVVASLLILWAATGIALYVGATVILALAADEANLAEERAAWAAGAVIVLAIVHGALNIAFSYHRNWARWGTLALAAAYAACLIITAILNLIEEGTNRWLVLALLCLVPLALIASLATADARTWCRRPTPHDSES
ncbi:hypothetical protein O1R50_12855 [Glycomyces luteolus]|uniref:Uncharacterized protein n=1 Tax=Glycomyces luteolus TaxID=2670330 RepID=A0A9X3P9F3_9ACTN|nr:hypothetical protein [Glycomyces luteolus]MDA1360519.1 hypothetical protein [Glycomyces luteolus]